LISAQRSEAADQCEITDNRRKSAKPPAGCGE
jgi:hypothetical protein